MVKLAQTIGATGIAQSQRLALNMGSHVIDVRQSLYSDVQEKDVTRVWPWTDIQYAGAEVAGNNSVIASCYVPMVTGVEMSEPGSSDQGLHKMKIHSLQGIKDFATTRGDPDPLKWMCSGWGMTDYIFGIDQTTSRSSSTGDFNKNRLALYETWTEKKDKVSLDGTAPLEIQQYLTEDQALDDITANPQRMIIGFVMGPRDVKLYYTETAIGMMVRRLRRVVEALGPRKPIYFPLGLGHLSKGDKPWYPKDSKRKGSIGGVPQVTAPTGSWDAGAVQYRANSLRAKGTFYIPTDQTPYSTMRRNFKYNHILTQVGLELLETMQAVGIGMNDKLGISKVAAFKENGTGTQVAALQMLFSSMFGTTTTHNATSDFTVDEASVAGGIKDRLGMLFNSGHIHIDPGVFMYSHGKKDAQYLKQDGYLNTQASNSLKYKTLMEDKSKRNNVSAALLMKEFIAKYLTFTVCAQALESYFSVPLYQCHWLYVGSPKPEYVTEQLQMNFRSDVYFDGDNSLPFTLIPSRLNPGEVISRIPCYLDIKANTGAANTYLGVRDPLSYGSVMDIRYSGDKPLTTVEEREYTFAPIIEADASVQTQYRNSRTVNCSVWPRPTVYSPGATRMGAVYGMLSDNSSVGGHYFYQPLTGTFLNDDVKLDTLYRSTMNSSVAGGDGALAKQYFKGQGIKEIGDQGEYWEKHTVEPKHNPQVNAGKYSKEELKAMEVEGEPSVFPTTVSGRNVE